MLSFMHILGRDSGGRDEVMRVLSATGVTGLITIGAVMLLYRKGLKLQAASASVAATLIGGYYIFLVLAFGAEYL